MLLIAGFLGRAPFMEQNWRGWLPRIPCVVWLATSIGLLVGTVWFAALSYDVKEPSWIRMGVSLGAILFTANYVYIGARFHYHRTQRQSDKKRDAGF